MKRSHWLTRRLAVWSLLLVVPGWVVVQAQPPDPVEVLQSPIEVGPVGGNLHWKVPDNQGNWVNAVAGKSKEIRDDHFQTPDYVLSAFKVCPTENCPDGAWLHASWVAFEVESTYLSNRNYKFRIERTEDGSRLVWTIKRFFTQNIKPCVHAQTCVYDGLPPEGFGKLVGEITASYKDMNGNDTEGPVKKFRMIPKPAPSK